MSLRTLTRAALGFVAAVGAALPAGADSLTPAEEAVVAQAITILKDYDRCCKTAAPAGFSQAISVADCLVAIALSGNFCSKNLGEGAFGGKTLDDKTANCADKDVIILASRMLDSGKKGADFIDLLITLFHEGTHALQDLSAVTTADYFDKVTGPLEVQAWANEKLFLQQFKAALQKVRQNIIDGNPTDTGLTDCEKKLMACYLADTTPEQLAAMVQAACAAIALQCRTVAAITAWLNEKCPPAAAPDGAPRDQHARAEDGSHRAGSGPSDSGVGVIEIPSTGTSVYESEVDTTLDEVLGLAFQEDGLGNDYLIVSGRRGDRGIVQIWCDTTPDAEGGFEFLGEVDTTVRTLAPSGLVAAPAAPGATLLLFDEVGGQIYAMTDGDANGVVDTFDPTPRLGMPVDTSGYVRLEVSGPNEYTLSLFAIGSMTADLPEIRLTDADLDFMFTPSADQVVVLSPQQDPGRAPNLCSRPFEFFTIFVVIGAPGHQLQLAMTTAEGVPIAPLAPPAIVGPDNVAVFNVNPPGFQPGTFCRVFDVNNGRWSAVYPVEPPLPIVYTASGNAGPGSGGTQVAQNGALLDQLGITQVLVGGVPAPSFTVMPNRVDYVTPPNVPVAADGITEHALHVAVQFVYDDGQGIAPAVLEAQPFAYVDPILAPESLCRQGNVNAAAGPITDVLFVNGSAGIGAARRVYVAPSDPFTLSIVRPPSKPSGSSKCCIYVWVGEGSAATVSAQPFDLGMTCRATPLNVGAPGQPKKIANSIGFPGQLGAEDWPGPPTAPAPTTLLSVGTGLNKIGTFLFQGFIVDSAAPNGQAAVTNAVIVVSQ